MRLRHLALAGTALSSVRLSHSWCVGEVVDTGSDWSADLVEVAYDFDDDNTAIAESRTHHAHLRKDHGRTT